MNARTTTPRTVNNPKASPGKRPPETPAAAAAPDPDELETGQLAAFIKTLSPDQRAMWTPIRRAWRREVNQAKAVRGGGPREDLASAFAHVKAKITPAKLEQLVMNAIAKGDAQMFRVLAMLAGEDLSERPQAAPGPGAEVIILREYEAPKAN